MIKLRLAVSYNLPNEVEGNKFTKIRRVIFKNPENIKIKQNKNTLERYRLVKYFGIWDEDQFLSILSYT